MTWNLLRRVSFLAFIVLHSTKQVHNSSLNSSKEISQQKQLDYKK